MIVRKNDIIVMKDGSIGIVASSDFYIMSPNGRVLYCRPIENNFGRRINIHNNAHSLYEGQIAEIIKI